MKILHSIFTHDDGGTERHVADLTAAQAAAGHEVSIMIRGDRASNRAEDAFLGWVDDRVEIIKLPSYWPFLQWPSLPISGKLKQLKPDIIHTHHGRDSRYMAKAAGDIPVVATLHMHYRAKDYPLHNGLICVSPWQLETVPADRRKDTVVIPNWAQDFAYENVANRAELRARLELPEDTILFGCVSRLSPEKAPDDLVEAFLMAGIEKSHLVIFGTGELQLALEQKIAPHADKITLMGYEKEIRPWYKAFDIFVLPSRSESFGLVLLEAMDAGCLIVSTRTDGANDLLGQNDSVFMAEIASPASLANALTKAAMSAFTRIEYTELSSHTLTQANKDVLNFYQRFLRQ